MLTERSLAASTARPIPGPNRLPDAVAQPRSGRLHQVCSSRLGATPPLLPPSRIPPTVCPTCIGARHPGPTSMSAMQPECGARPENRPTLRENALVQTQCGSAVPTMASSEAIQRKTTFPTSLCDEAPGTRAGDVCCFLHFSPSAGEDRWKHGRSLHWDSYWESGYFKFPDSLREMFECESRL